jgi:hypothetical protein
MNDLDSIVSAPSAETLNIDHVWQNSRRASLLSVLEPIHFLASHVSQIKGIHTPAQ